MIHTAYQDARCQRINHGFKAVYFVSRRDKQTARLLRRPIVYFS
jgi:hypothetical protein